MTKEQRAYLSFALAALGAMIVIIGTTPETSQDANTFTQGALSALFVVEMFCLGMFGK